MSKGVVFTMDAVVALAIFIASLFIFYSYFVTVEPFGLRGAGIYTKADNFLSVEDSSEEFSKVLNYYQGADNKTCNSSSLSYQQLANISANLTEYPANLRLYVYNDSTKSVDLVCNYAPNVFSDKVILRRYVTLSLTRTSTIPPQNVTCGINATRSNRTVPIWVTVFNPSPLPLLNLNVSFVGIGNYTGPIGWMVMPPNWKLINITIPFGSNVTYFNLTIPSDAVVDEYNSLMMVYTYSHDLYAIGVCPFNVVQFGMVELEVGV